jgi:hypothetical protein
MSTIGAKIDKMHKLREDKRKLEEQVKLIQAQMATLEIDLIADMDKQGVSKSTGVLATVSISENIRPSVEDWDAFYAYIHKYKYYHLMERRPSVSGCNELLETKGKIPGVVPFTQRKLNVRSV